MVCSARSILPRNLFYREQLSQTSIILSRCAEEKALRDCSKIDLDQHHWPQRMSWFVLFDQFFETTTDPRFECFHQSKRVQVISQDLTTILTKIQLRNLNQTSASKSWIKFRLKYQPNFSPKSLDKSSASKYQPKFSIKIFKKHHWSISTLL